MLDNTRGRKGGLHGDSARQDYVDNDLSFRRYERRSRGRYLSHCWNGSSMTGAKWFVNHQKGAMTVQPLVPEGPFTTAKGSKMQGVRYLWPVGIGARNERAGRWESRPAIECVRACS